MDTSKGISLIVISQPTCPAVLVSGTHAPWDFLHSAILRNAGEKALTGFRLGWLTRFTSRGPKVRFGAAVKLPKPIDPGTFCSVPAQQIGPDDARTGLDFMAVFLAEVYLASWKPWRADLRDIYAANVF
jgi:hypothetical protein